MVGPLVQELFCVASLELFHLPAVIFRRRISQVLYWCSFHGSFLLHASDQTWSFLQAGASILYVQEVLSISIYWVYCENLTRLLGHFVLLSAIQDLIGAIFFQETDCRDDCSTSPYICSTISFFLANIPYLPCLHSFSLSLSISLSRLEIPERIYALENRK